MAEYFHYLVNIEDYPDFLPMARQLALDFFAKADYSDPVWLKNSAVSRRIAGVVAQQPA